MHVSNIVNRVWFKSLFLSVISSYFYVFMDWIFFATKASFMSSMDLLQKVIIFLMASFILMLPTLILTSLSLIIARFSKAFIWLNAIIPALILAVLSLVLVDNFTYTILKFGIVTSKGMWRGAYAVVFLTLFIYFLKNISNHLQRDSGNQPNLSHYLVLFFISVSVMGLASQFKYFQFGAQESEIFNSQTSQLPNIILLGIDGVNASNMSVYGYERDTTPSITRLSKNALVVENAYSNAGNTGGALTSILTGKLPTETHVVYPPDILMEENAYQHLPGILKQLGYSTVQLTDPSYGDAYSRNIKNGFDIANFRSESTNPILDEIGKLGGGGSFYFSALIIQRATERLNHIFYYKTMINPYQLVTQPVSEFTEEQRYNAMISTLETANGPLFLHVHMLLTHGPRFSPRENIFSTGKTQDQLWMIDYYDDAILDADRYVKELFEYLTKTGKIKNTLVILYSDHGMVWNPRNRVPLIFWFPDNKYVGKIQGNVQLIDIAPTIFDYLGVSQPGWMHGQSILLNELSPDRKIISVSVDANLLSNEENEGWRVDETKISPPYYQLGTVNLIVCDKWFSLKLRTPTLTYGDVKGSTEKCSEMDLPSPEQAKELILQHLEDENYDTSDFPAAVPLQAMP
jgi:hypothetical protein